MHRQILIVVVLDDNDSFVVSSSYFHLKADLGPVLIVQVVVLDLKQLLVNVGQIEYAVVSLGQGGLQVV